MINITSLFVLGLGILANFLVEKEEFRKQAGSFASDLVDAIKKAWNEPVENKK